ncbi:uncharacterized protein LOC111830605 [Capsella rubella]|uniref:uncharacterized protein LOC111830605 n=1 Tax=Capsella rubella TaxID=81985 RepID=UPI000CD4F191|nr:uncharacterized protein LOC111830605 [Capsella rubella]
MAKWAIELSEYDIEYRSRPSLKSLVLADFIVVLAPEIVEDASKIESWTLYVDGSSCNQGSGVRILLRSPTGEVLEQSLKLGFKASNNEAEYEALLAGIRLARGIGIKHIQVFCYSQLVVSQFSGEFDTKNERMSSYLALVRSASAKFDSFSLTKIPRCDNTSADALAALASNANPDLRRSIPIESIDLPSIAQPHEINLIMNDLIQMEIDPVENEPHDEEAPPVDWREDIKLYIQSSQVPENRWQARRLKARCANYILADGELLRRSSNGTFLTCVDRDESERIMGAVHEGDGGNHSGGRALALKIKKDFEAFAQKCEAYQRHATLKHVPPESLSPVTAPYPFMRWAMDITGPFPPCRTKRFLLVLTDFFTKWVEAESFNQVKSGDVTGFIWKYIICRHGIPYEIVTDNGSQFTSYLTKRFFRKWHIKLSTSTPRYPKGNGQAEDTNKTILDGIKKRLGRKKGLWADELDGVLWSHRTTPRRATGFSPFALAYGVEAMAPSEVGIPTLLRTMMIADPELNEARLHDHLDWSEELRDQDFAGAHRLFHQMGRSGIVQSGQVGRRNRIHLEAEATNKTILDGIKKRLGRKKGLWADELDGVLWSHRTTPRRATGFSPFALAYGVEAMAPSEVGIPTLRRTMMIADPELNDTRLHDHLDWSEELRDQAMIRIQNYQNSAAKYYNKTVRERRFNEGDLVLREVFENTKELNAGKLGAKWEGPYIVARRVHPGVYELSTMEGQRVQHFCNAAHLKRFYY